jgi:hypothetical protein
MGSQTFTVVLRGGIKQELDIVLGALAPLKSQRDGVCVELAKRLGCLAEWFWMILGCIAET